MTNKIKVLIADDIATREHVVKLFESDSEIIVVGQASSAEEAVQQAKMLNPDIVLIGNHMPEIDAFTATDILSSEVPFSSVILMGPQGGSEDLRRAMLAGAKDFIVKPFPGDELSHAIKQVYVNQQRRKVEPLNHAGGKVVAVFSPKGGVGKTMLAANLAVALASNDNVKVAIVDCDLQFGDVAICLDVFPKASIADMVTDIEHLDDKVLSRYMISFNDNLSILPAPLQPEQAENIMAQHLDVILKLLKKKYQFIIIDTFSIFNDITLTLIDLSDLVLLLSAPDLMTTKKIKLSLETFEKLGYPHGKINLILNRANAEGGLKINEIEESLHHQFVGALPSDSELVLSSINKGVPFVVSNPNSTLAREVFALAEKITKNELETPDKGSGGRVKTPGKSVFSKFKNLFGKNGDN